MTPAQVCAVLRIDPVTFWDLARTGELPIVGGREGITVTDAAVEEYIARSLPERLAP